MVNSLYYHIILDDIFEEYSVDEMISRIIEKIKEKYKCRITLIRVYKVYPEEDWIEIREAIIKMGFDVIGISVKKLTPKNPPMTVMKIKIETYSKQIAKEMLELMDEI